MSDRPSELTYLALKQVSLAVPFGNLLTDISFTLTKGDRLAIIGASGAGKTTLLRLLNRLINPTRGTIEFANRPLTTFPIIQLRQQIVLVPQEPKLLGMRVEEALIYPLKLQKLPPREIQHRLAYWSDKLSLAPEWLERNELQLSLGQRQLVAIARALMMQPQILLLDEPTSALDIGRASYLLEVLTELAKQQQTTIIMVNHQLELAQQFSQRVIYLEAGKLIRDCLGEDIPWCQLKEELLSAEIKINQEW